jgi:UDP-glucose 4-epimerase
MAALMPKKKVALILGTNELIGDVADALQRGRDFDQIVTAGEETGSGTKPHVAVRLLERGAERKLAEILAEAAPTVVVDLWRSESVSQPARVGRYDAAAAETVVAGLRLWATRGGKSCRRVVLSSTAVYGASSVSPVLRAEGDDVDAVTPDEHGRWVEELREREAVYGQLAGERGWRVLCLRAAAVVGGPLRSEVTDFLEAPLPVRAIGFDPPIQLLHYSDLVEALARGAAEDVDGTLNVVGRGVVALSRLAALGGRVALPVPMQLARHLSPTALGTEALKWRCVADGRRAEQVLGFRARYTAEEAVAA